MIAEKLEARMPVRGLESFALKANHAIGAHLCLLLKFRPEAVHYSINSAEMWAHGELYLKNSAHGMPGWPACTG